MHFRGITAACVSITGEIIVASTGRTLVSAHFQVMHAGQTVFDKTLKDEHTWESSFIGAVAIPRALNEYQPGYANLLGQLYKDRDFLRACRAPQ